MPAIIKNPKGCQQHKPNKQQGIALIQVLLITAVLSILALFLTSTAKDQIKMAQWADDKASALVAVQSAEAELLFALLTTTKRPDNNISTDNENNNANNQAISRQWNFFAKPFVINTHLDTNTSINVNVQIQDQGALIHAHFPDPDFLKALIAYQGLATNEVNHIYDNLLDWQDLDNIPRINGNDSLSETTVIRNGAVPDLHDFGFVADMPPKVHAALLNNTTLYSRGFFNPMDAPEELLSAITNVEIAKQVIQLRETNQLTDAQFSQITGIFESDKVLLYPSNILTIKFEGKVGESLVHKNIIVELTPYANQYQLPINILSNRG